MSVIYSVDLDTHCIKPALPKKKPQRFCLWNERGEYIEQNNEYVFYILQTHPARGVPWFQCTMAGFRALNRKTRSEFFYDCVQRIKTRKISTNKSFKSTKKNELLQEQVHPQKIRWICSPQPIALVCSRRYVIKCMRHLIITRLENTWRRARLFGAVGTCILRDRSATCIWHVYRAHHGMGMSGSCDIQMTIYGHMWHGLTHSLVL